MTRSQRHQSTSQIEVYIDLCFWALPAALCWTFTSHSNIVSLHLLCFEIKVSWA